MKVEFVRTREFNETARELKTLLDPEVMISGFIGFVCLVSFYFGCIALADLIGI